MCELHHAPTMTSGSLVQRGSLQAAHVCQELAAEACTGHKTDSLPTGCPLVDQERLLLAVRNSGMTQRRLEHI